MTFSFIFALYLEKGKISKTAPLFFKNVSIMVKRWLGEHAEDGETVLEKVAYVEETGWPGSVLKGIVEE